MKRGKQQDVFADRPAANAVPDVKQLRKMAGDWLKLRRADAELSQADLAARLGLDLAVFQPRSWARGPASWALNRPPSLGIC